MVLTPWSEAPGDFRPDERMLESVDRLESVRASTGSWLPVVDPQSMGRAWDT
jgi:hypothetical protein